jgi:hypothetical protein
MPCPSVYMHSILYYRIATHFFAEVNLNSFREYPSVPSYPSSTDLTQKQARRITAFTPERGSAISKVFGQNRPLKGWFCQEDKYTDEQIAFVLIWAEAGTRVKDIIRKMGISEQTFHNWNGKADGSKLSRCASSTHFLGCVQTRYISSADRESSAMDHET